MRIFKCSFCGDDIQVGKGLTYFKIDGTPLHFCSSKCKKSLLLYNRKPRRVKWTKHYPRQPKQSASASNTAEKS
ncbi:MAG: 50S ribosomal protein L24e [Candidatus Odinarchaeum yellowstonii]|uniref:50S ribosomal protein L24e n=1 Tax=Odinarchaeota yellowstonii (strain LCB_4) TaxID=1841599 RepID=A0AAF0D149_ODILC|nr:MAG: 50S ribosomal protein L24e [Candidatus Odinarchaeum yellowstonii]